MQQLLDIGRKKCALDNDSSFIYISCVRALLTAVTRHRAEGPKVRDYFILSEC